ncbi:MAG: TetR/AcrR family transcriptional regulator [Clostridiales bacterium]|nr:TetR/AcrR family transcriptional regulator [Clostridiales bacterium]
MKKGDARRSELLLAAERLFYTKGYEKTSVQDILTEMNFSKGGFYHHFDSKLSVLEAICELRAQECCEAARQAAAQAEGTAVDQLNAVFHDSAILTSGNSSFISLMIHVAYREDGALMREKMKKSQLAGMQSVLEEILAQGVKEKEFFVRDVPACAQMLLRMYLVFTDEIAFLLAQEDSEEALLDELVRKLNTYRMAIERVLAAPFGSMVLFEAKELQLLAQAILRDRVRRRADALLGK